MYNFLRLLALLALAGLGLGWYLTAPRGAAPDVVAGLSGDAARGERIFHATGCAGCHAAEGATGDARLELGGGRRLVSDFGPFMAPNISPHPEHGIGGWSAVDLVNAMQHGVSPQGRHYYPSFPWTSYALMEVGDIFDLKAYLDTLPAVDRPSAAHQLPFPFGFRRLIGGWKLLHHRPEFHLGGPGLSAEVMSGRYLVEAMAHCAECHTPRGPLGGLERGRWMAGAPNPSGDGRIPAIDPANLSWSESEIAYYLETGFTPTFDSAGGSMAEVIRSLSQLEPEDRRAIAAYLKALR